MRRTRHVKPGGWVEVQEMIHIPFTVHDDGYLPEDHPVAHFWSLIREGLAACGVDSEVLEGGGIANKMRRAGFVEVTERTIQIPIGTWPKNKALKTVGLFWRTILIDGLQALALGPLTRGLKWTRERVEVFLMAVRRAYQDNAALMYMPMHIVYGQKPR